MDIKLVNLMADLMEKETITMVKELINGGTNPMEILALPGRRWRLWESGLKEESTLSRFVYGR